MEAALLGLVGLLLGAAILGKGGNPKEPFLQFGDRIGAGMVALPLLALMARQVTGSPLAAFAPLPLVAYLTMLLKQDGGSAFSMVSYIAGLLTYAGLLVFLLLLP